MPCTDLELCRTEIARVADALEVLIEQHGNREKAAAATGIGLAIFTRFLRRGACERLGSGRISMNLAGSRENCCPAM